MISGEDINIDKSNYNSTIYVLTLKNKQTYSIIHLSEVMLYLEWPTLCGCYLAQAKPFHRLICRLISSFGMLIADQNYLIHVLVVLS